MGNRHSVHGRTTQRSTRLTLSSLSGSITGLLWKGRSLFQFLPDLSLSHLNYGSRSYDIGLCGTSMSGICYIIAKQYWEAWGLFWKRSVSLCFLGVLFGFGFSVVCFVFCCLVFCVCWWHLGFCLTFSLIRGNSQSKQNVLMTVWASSAHGTGKKKKCRKKGPQRTRCLHCVDAHSRVIFLLITRYQIPVYCHWSTVDAAGWRQIALSAARNGGMWCSRRAMVAGNNG